MNLDNVVATYINHFAGCGLTDSSTTQGAAAEYPLGDVEEMVNAMARGRNCALAVMQTGRGSADALIAVLQDDTILQMFFPRKSDEILDAIEDLIFALASID